MSNFTSHLPKDPLGRNISSGSGGGKYDISNENHSSSLFSLKRKEQLRTAEITHVLSVARMPFKKDLLQGYKHLQVEVDDVEDENLLEHFSETNRFIQDGLDGGGGVFAHWYVLSNYTTDTVSMNTRLCCFFRYTFSPSAHSLIIHAPYSKSLLVLRRNLLVVSYSEIYWHLSYISTELYLCFKNLSSLMNVFYNGL